tara:strand:- start:2949 stop:3467 length:519 start_codon:yes stop_codon:yes gene_type:complete
MWGNIFSGAMSIAQGDSPEEILKKQAMASMTQGFTGGAPVGVDSASGFAPHLAQTGVEQASSNLAQQGFMGSMGDALGGFGDTMSEFGGEINEFTGMENRDWTQLGLEQGLGAMEGTPNQPMMVTPAPSAQGQPNALEGQMAGGLLNSHVKPNSPQGLDPNMLRQLQMRGLV